MGERGVIVGGWWDFSAGLSRCMDAKCCAKKNIKHLSFGRKSVPLQADYYQKRISD